jgi:hypothetical protein
MMAEPAGPSSSSQPLLQFCINVRVRVFNHRRRHESLQGSPLELMAIAKPAKSPRSKLLLVEPASRRLEPLLHRHL